MPYPVLARTLRGLEELAAAEVREQLAPRSIALAHRELRFETPSLADALTLGVADDVFLVVADLDFVGHTRRDLQSLRKSIRCIDLDTAAARIAGLRPVRAKTFDVTASVRGRHNYSRFDLEDAVGDAVSAATGWSYRSRRNGRPPQTSLTLRVHATPERTTAAVRLGERPLHHRGYRVASRPGALHPPLARALVRLAEPAERLRDPFCGTGTIPIEAKLARPHLAVCASDVDPGAVAAARRNAAAAGVRIDLHVADAGRLAGPIESIVTNPPWGLRVASVELEPFWRQARRAAGRVALVVPAPAIPHGFEVLHRSFVRVSGTAAEIVVLAAR